MSTNNKPMKVGHLENLGTLHLTFGVLLFGLSIIITMITAPMLVGATMEIQADDFDFSAFLGVGSFLLLCYFLGPLLIWIGAFRIAKGDRRIFLPADVFSVESAYRSESGIFAVLSGSGGESFPAFVLLKASSKLDIMGFPERAFGPGEFYLEVEDHHTKNSGTKRGHWHQNARKWRTCTFIPVSVNAPATAEGAHYIE